VVVSAYAVARKASAWLPRGLIYFALLIAVTTTAFPFFYTVSLSLQSSKEVFSGISPLLPEKPLFSNYAELWRSAPFGTFLRNSLIVAITVTLLHLLLDPLAGYVFAKYQFSLRDVLFSLILGTMMIPVFTTLIPRYVIVDKLHWVNTFAALIIPFSTSAFGIFLMRQFIQPLPTELIDAGRIDGASEFGIYWRIMLPQCRPALAVLGLFTFLANWNRFLWPLVVTNQIEMRVLTVAIALLNKEYYFEWNMVACASVILFVPGLILFLFTQRYFVQGISISGLK
jgi:multiple sugar transport system permease protein